MEFETSIAVNIIVAICFAFLGVIIGMQNIANANNRALSCMADGNSVAQCQTILGLNK